MAEIALLDSRLLAASTTPRREDIVACEHADRCGGCPLISVPYPEQLAIKHARLGNATGRYLSLQHTPTTDVAAANPITAYRTRAKLMVAEGARIGLFAKGGAHQVVDIPRCRVLAPPIARVAATLRRCVADAEVERGTLAPWGTSTAGSLRAVDLREVVDAGEARVLVTLVLERDRAAPLDDLRATARAIMAASPEVAGVACNFQQQGATQVLGAETVHLAGVDCAPDRVGASTHLATFGSFVQAHRGQADRVHTQIARALGLPAAGDGPRMQVLDLYGGSGAIALGIAAAGGRVHLVESFAPAVAQAKTAAARSGVELETECADVSAALRGMCERAEQVDAVVLNPPRRGAKPIVRVCIAQLRPRTIVYVSCDPETLARDLDHLARMGYATTSLQPVDMIPLSIEVETVAVLRHADPAPARALYEDAEILVVEKGAHEPTNPQGHFPGSLLSRVRRIPGAEEAAALHCPDAKTTGLVVFARRPADRAKWQQVLSSPSTRATYLAAAKGVTPSKGTVRARAPEPGDAAPASTRYRRVAVAGGHSMLRVVSGAEGTLPIRRHLARIGHPLLGDDRFGDAPTNRFFEERNGLDRPFLHCAKLEFVHPDTGKRCTIDVPTPGDLGMVMERMGAKGVV